MTVHPATTPPLERARPTGLGRIVVFGYGLVSYCFFLVVFLYAIGFVGAVWVPKHVNSGQPGPLVGSLVINGLLLCVFVLQHTIMARPWFKKRLTRYVPQAIERSTFVLLASGSLALVFWQWRPAPELVWQVTNPFGVAAITTLFVGGWALVLISTFLVSHFDLFGLRQVWLHLRSKDYEPIGFRLIGLYRLVRHPLMVGFLIAFWATPAMTVGHLFFAIMTTLYIFLGTTFEERDLVAFFGDQYREYRSRVRRFVPIPKRGAS